MSKMTEKEKELKRLRDKFEGVGMDDSSKTPIKSKDTENPVSNT